MLYIWGVVLLHNAPSTMRAASDSRPQAQRAQPQAQCAQSQAQCAPRGKGAFHGALRYARLSSRISVKRGGAAPYAATGAQGTKPRPAPPQAQCARPKHGLRPRPRAHKPQTQCARPKHGLRPRLGPTSLRLNARSLRFTAPGSMHAASGSQPQVQCAQGGRGGLSWCFSGMRGCLDE